MDEYKKFLPLTPHTHQPITIPYDLKSIAINYLGKLFFPTLYSREQKALQ